jgi:hypothetical protein
MHFRANRVFHRRETDARASMEAGLFEVWIAVGAADVEAGP